MTVTITERINSRMRLRSDLPEPDERRQIREAAGLSQQEIADALGVSRSAIAQWEQGVRYPRERYRAAYAEALDAMKKAGA
ncbi:helix-turn-helix domain-containing protein [Streptomyces sp. NPDC101115]|uniref:helix-turn-helix domain-containing protein n=1 Tax=Streptomyces sp. NPDC101115 TaxID=3366106 RepID=UPI0038161288